MSVTPEEIVEQRERGWPDFHPEDYCHQCGRPNIHAWFSPEWETLVGSHSGILCPVCFAALDPDPHAIWVVTKWQPPDADEKAALVSQLRCFMSAHGDELDRVACCLLDAGYQRRTSQ